MKQLRSLFLFLGAIALFLVALVVFNRNYKDYYFDDLETTRTIQTRLEQAVPTNVNVHVREWKGSDSIWVWITVPNTFSDDERHTIVASISPNAEEIASIHKSRVTLTHTTNWGFVSIAVAANTPDLAQRYQDSKALLHTFPEGYDFLDLDTTNTTLSYGNAHLDAPSCALLLREIRTSQYELPQEQRHKVDYLRIKTCNNADLSFSQDGPIPAELLTHMEAVLEDAGTFEEGTSITVFERGDVYITNSKINPANAGKAFQHWEYGEVRIQGR